MVTGAVRETRLERWTLSYDPGAMQRPEEK